MRNLKNFFNDQKKSSNTSNFVDFIHKNTDVQKPNIKSEENINP